MLFGNATYCQEKNFQLIGKIKGIDTGLIKINFLLTDSSIKRSFTTKIKKGKFTILGKIPHPMRGYLILNGSLISDDIFIEFGKQQVYFDATTKKSFYQSMKVTGSSVNDEFINKYQKLLQPFYDELDNCYETLDSLNKLFTDEKSDIIFAEPCKNFDMAVRNLDSVKRSYILKHSSSYVSLWGLYTSIWSIDNLEFVAESFDFIDSRVKNSILGKWMRKRIEVQKAFFNGKLFPVMIISDSIEKRIPIQEAIKGKFTLVDFWFSHCGPCIAQFPAMRKLYAKYKDVGFDVIGISIDNTANKQDWVNAIKKHDLKWKQYWDADGKEAGRFMFDTYPTSFLLDSNGRIIKKNIILEELEILLAENLK